MIEYFHNLLTNEGTFVGTVILSSLGYAMYRIAIWASADL